MASFESVRGYLQSFVSPLQYIANTPKQMMTWASENIVTRQELMAENQQYRLNELTFHEEGMQLEILKQENARLRSLLASPLRSDMKKMVAEILSVDSDPYTHQVVINRGAADGVFEGQPVLDAQGIVGQILHVGQNSSRVILITDISHSVPVRVNRNGLRLQASGSGRIDRLIHNFVPHSADIKVGDQLVTSGLAERFPAGYPVATVSEVRHFPGEKFIDSRKISTYKRMTLMSNEALKQAIISGLGYSIMPLIGIKNAISSGELQIIPVKGLPIITNWNLIWLSSKNMTNIAKSLIEHIETEKEAIIKKHFDWLEKY